ncbi:MAG: hypothetical protein ACLRP8_05960 [Roseburia intestinalis]
MEQELRGGETADGEDLFLAQSDEAEKSRRKEVIWFSDRRFFRAAVRT